MIQFTAEQMRELADVHEASGRPQSAKQLRAAADCMDKIKQMAKATLEAMLEAAK